jgi:alpha-galactosidase
LKIVIIGAGSQIFGRRSVIDVLLEKQFNDLPVELVLVDINEQKLELMYRFSQMVGEFLHSQVHVSATTDRKQALLGATHVFIAVSYHRYELWEQDFRVPYSYGFKQAYAENGGPGALFHALRNIHIIMDICSDIEIYCPQALVFNFSNPESRVLLAMSTLTNINAIGLCHGQHDALQAVCKLLERPWDSVTMRGGGINHFFWIQSIVDTTTGEDLYPLVKRKASQETSMDFALTKELLRIYGMLTYPDSTHAGEFMSCGYSYMQGKWKHGLESRSIATTHKSQQDMLSPYLTGSIPINPILVASREIAVPIIVAMQNGIPTEFTSGNFVNSGLYIPNLNPDGVVEVPILVDGKGIHPQSIPALPEGVASMCRTQMSIQKLTVQAYQERSKNLLLQTLLLEPTVDDIPKAEALIDDMLELQKDYLPVFHA